MKIALRLWIIRILFGVMNMVNILIIMVMIVIGMIVIKMISILRT